MSGFIEGESRYQSTMFPERLDDYVSPSGYYDWFLPSQDEMVRMGVLYPLIPPDGIDSMISGYHWSSTETEEDPPPADPFDDFAVVVNIGGTGSEGIGVPCLVCSPKLIQRVFRAVRTF